MGPFIASDAAGISKTARHGVALWGILDRNYAFANIWR